MVLDFGKLNSGISAGKQTEPRKIFTTLKREPRFKRPSDEQADVLNEWFDNRTRKNNTIKMNTGSGKTLVGLLCLQSSINEGVYPAVYITPDNYLLNQVVKEAKSLGIPVTQDENDPNFVSGKAIFVANIVKLVNGKSVFGVASEGTKIKIGSLVIDDAHACLSTVAEKFSLKLDSNHPAYAEILYLFKAEMQNQSPSGVLDIEAEDPQSLMVVPYWAWQDHQQEVLKILHPHRKKDPVMWSWELLKDVLSLCQCVFGGSSLEISPRVIPADNIPSFTGATRRIYMTATLADDSILVSHFQADAAEVASAIKPKGGGDIGDRMILAPQEINPDIEIAEIRGLARDLSEHYNVCVIVPSDKKAKDWSGIADQTLKADNLEQGVNKLKQGHVGLTVLVNKYDGIDLPNKACEILILDGLPEVFGLAERVEQTLLDGTRRQLLRQVQRIEQGMGRGVRSSEDHCVVILIGARLTQRIHNPDARNMFTSATQAQLDLGKQIAEQAKGKSIDEIEQIIDLCLDRDDNWVTTSRNAVVNAPEKLQGNVDKVIIHTRAAFDAARIQRGDIAIQEIQSAILIAVDNKAKGYLKQQLAEYTHQINPVLAQELQLAAFQLNRNLTKPLQGILYSKLTPPTNSQAKTAVSAMTAHLEGNDLLIWVNGLIEDLSWGEENTDRFENAMRDLGKFLGFRSQRPEKSSKGPDNLWAVGKLHYFVIECKSGATKAERISKHDCNQLTGSMVWFEENYDNSCTATPILVHQKLLPEHAASLHQEVRIIDELHLNKIIKSVRNYAKSIATGNRFTDAKEVAKQLIHFNLTGETFVSAMTTRPKKLK